MLAFIQSQPNIVERLLLHIETPSFVDLLGRIIQLDETIPNSNVLEVGFEPVIRACLLRASVNSVVIIRKPNGPPDKLAFPKPHAYRPFCRDRFDQKHHFNGDTISRSRTYGRFAKRASVKSFCTRARNSNKHLEIGRVHAE